MMQDSTKRAYVLVLASCATVLIVGILTYFYHVFEVSRALPVFKSTDSFSGRVFSGNSARFLSATTE